jgi:hypothetical protein
MAPCGCRAASGMSSDICERFIFVRSGQLTHATDFEILSEHACVQDFLGELFY